MKYISLFSGIGGLEHPTVLPILYCEKDPVCADHLLNSGHDVELVEDVTELDPVPKADVVCGGWPCQDLSEAGKRTGLSGQRSSLFYELVRVARAASADTLIAENVHNLLKMGRGETFRTVLKTLREDYPHVSWRTLDARALGLPQRRIRVLLVASKDPAIALALHRKLPLLPERQMTRVAAGFYWTAGTHSIAYEVGSIPTLKVGSALSIPSPPAVHFDGTVRKLTPAEALQLQGFDPNQFRTMSPSDAYRVAGNAVPVPLGRFAFDCLLRNSPECGKVDHTGPFRDGYMSDRGMWSMIHPDPALCSNLGDYIEWHNRDPISARAAAGLLRRLERSGRDCPRSLRDLLVEVTRT